MKIMYVNYGFRIEYESDLRTNEHYLGSCESKARKKKKTKQNKTKQKQQQQQQQQQKRRDLNL